jgi:hypothetical protein
MDTLGPDPEAAPVVQRIFVLQGDRCSRRFRVHGRWSKGTPAPVPQAARTGSQARPAEKAVAGRQAVQPSNGYQVNCPVVNADAINLAVELTQRALDNVRGHEES